MDVPSLPQRQRLLLADPVLLGVQAGVTLVDPCRVSQPMVELLQASVDRSPRPRPAAAGSRRQRMPPGTAAAPLTAAPASSAAAAPQPAR
ncbi:hypothetical protein [Salinispora arenicola]|uniref:hypothetical protein n=1 Tax=Salinispora arenicola TaxID=168697 RepID=UPI0039AF0CB9